MDARVVLILAVLGIAQCKQFNSCSDTKSFVDGHNRRRSQLAKGQVSGQPAASRMTYVIWHEELATKAQNWASKNQYGHNPDRTIPSGRFIVGENIYEYGTTDMDFKFDPEMAMKSWWDEHVHYTYSRWSRKSFRGPEQIGHYTQMAWEKSTRLGCGISQYHEDGWNNFYVVCNYGSAGNVRGNAPYKTGAGASGYLVCDSNTDCKQQYGLHC